MKYQHVERLGRTSTRGILDGVVHIFPKLDGTNAHIWNEKDGICFGSRNRQLSLDNDNAGFMNKCSKNPALMKLMGRLPLGTHVYGEWLVPHTLKDYVDEAWQRFYIFDIRNEDGSYWTYEDISDLCYNAEYEDIIHPLMSLVNPTPDKIIEVAATNTFLMREGCVGEGVVCKNYDYVNKWGEIVWAKYVVSEFKEKKIGKSEPKYLRDDMVEPKIVEKFLTKAMIDKVEAKIMNWRDEDNMHTGWTGAMIPRLLGMVWHDFITEELFDALKKFKNPTIDFRYLQSCVTAKIKELREDLF
jgi:hypothetical protein